MRLFGIGPLSSSKAAGPLLVCLPLLLCLPAAAEHPNHAEGFRPENTYELGDIEHVNLFNGNLNLTIPIGPSYPVGPGLSYGLVLTYTGNLWEWEKWPDQVAHRNYLQALIRERSNAGLGWEIGFGRLLGGSFPSNHETSEVYLGPDQSQHSFFPRLHPGEESNLQNGVQYTQDATYLRLRGPESIPEGTRFLLDSPDGVTRTFVNGRLTEMKDPFGNWVTVEYTGYDVATGEFALWTVKDSHERTQILEFTNLIPTVPHLGMVISKITLDGFGTQPMEYNFEYDTEDQLPRACNDPLVCTPERLCGEEHTDPLVVPLLRKVILPDGSAYAMPKAAGEEPDAYNLDFPTNITSETDCPDRTLSGHLEALELPTGGRYEWSWQTYSFPLRSQRITARFTDPEDYSITSPFSTSVGLAERRHYDQGSTTALGTWTYSQGIELTDLWETEVWTQVTRYPVGGVTRHYFSGYVDDEDPLTGEPDGFFGGEYGLPLTRRTLDGTSGRALSQEVFDGDPDLPGTSKLRTVYVDYERSGDSQSRANPRLVSELTVYEDDPVDQGLRFAATDFSDFDGFGNHRTAVTSGNFFGADNRTTYTDYNPGRSVSNIPGSSESWVLGTYTQQQVTEGGQIFKRELCFDASTGFLKRTRTFALIGAGTTAPARSGKDLVLERLQSAGSGSQTDGFVRRERYFGGDSSGLGTGGLCGLSLGSPAYQQNHTYTAGVLATSGWEGTSFLTVDRTIDTRTGLIKESRDTALFKTTYTYDEMGRLLSETPEEGAITVYTYTKANGSTPAQVTIETKESVASNTALTSQKIHFDGFGRPELERRLMPGDLWAERSTLRNALGLVYQRSEWEADGDPEPSVTQYELFDPFGRPGRITLPGGQQITLSYTGISQRFLKVPVGTTLGQGGTVTTTQAVTAEYYDRFGRLAEVREPIDPGNKPRTLYTYNALGNLTKVQQDFGETPSQTRTFSYDGRGFLTSESHPELGGAVGYSLYDALGNPGRVLRGDWDLRHTYDAAGRPVQIAEPGASCGDPPSIGCWKQWTYATDNNQAGVRSNGKLLSMRRHNWVVSPPSRFDTNPELSWVDPWAEESYTYDGVGGRISRVTTTIGTGEPVDSGTSNANTRPVFLYDLDYDALGNVVSRSYPNCTHRYCIDIPLGDRQRTVAQTFSQGLLASVPGYASSVSYYPNGLVDEVHHDNGVFWIQDNDPDDMARPARIRTSGASTELNTGVYEYDAAGNVTRTGADRYVYDLLSRISEARLGEYVEGCAGDITLAGVTESVPRTWETCGTIHGGPDYTVASDVTLRAEEQVVFYDGFSVASGASLAVEAGAAVNDSPATPVERSQSYTYDRFGNLLSTTTTEAGGGSTLLTFATDSSTNHLSSSLVLYDTAGNVTDRQVATGVWWAFDHDPFNMMRNAMPTTTTGYEYLYGPGDERIGVIDWTGSPSDWVETYTVRDLDGRPLRQYRVDGGNDTGNWSVIRDYIWRGSSLLALETPSGTLHMHPDHLGSPRLITDATGTTVAEHVYFPFGEEATDPTQDAEVAKFTVHERDFHLPDPPLKPPFPITLANVSDDLDYMHARYYSPHLGRFMSVDPSAQSWDPRQPQSWNRYAYVRGNPLKYVDPDGQVLDTVLDVGFIGYDLFDIGRSLVKGEKVSGTQLLALSADVGAAFLPLVTGAGAAVRAGAHADDVVHGVELARRLGEAGEAAVRASVDIGEKQAFRIAETGKLRIPDGVNRTLGTLSEVKNVKKLSFTSQLRDFVKISKANDLKFVLFVRKDTKLSKPLMEAIERGEITLRFIPE